MLPLIADTVGKPLLIAIASVLVALVPQALLAVTLMLPLAVPLVTVTCVVFCPAVILQPLGTAQVILVELVIAELYTKPLVL